MLFMLDVCETLIASAAASGSSAGVNTRRPLESCSCKRAMAASWFSTPFRPFW
ncbi:Uncharacterised protein [Bordetella pertussis]|nr:Uncharacterised protein [Bordetella pertussis]